MLKPTFRLFIIPLGAICTLASMSAQQTARTPADRGVIQVRQPETDCSGRAAAEICVISFAGETAR